MAIKKTITTAHGFEAVDAYHRVECVEIVGRSAISYRVRSYKDNSGLPFFSEIVVTSAYELDGDNPIAQAYAHVKSLSQFFGAKDC
jgi:hypothetical protein